jgi:hypothetical protein
LYPFDIGAALRTSLTITGIAVMAERPLTSLALNVTVKFFVNVRFKTPLYVNVYDPL